MPMLRNHKGNNMAIFCSMRKYFNRVVGAGILILLVLHVPHACTAMADSVAVQFDHDPARGQMWVCIEGQKALCYQYGDSVDLPHFYPINSPAGQSMTVQQTEPYPHHRSFWFADRVALEGQRTITVYEALYSGIKTTDNNAQTTYVAPYQDGVRHVAFEDEGSKGDTGKIEFRLLWFMDHDRPLLDEHRSMRIRSLGNGEYFIDITFTVIANYGDVRFSSDAVHYAWPYLRMNGEFAVPGGARIVGSKGSPTKDRINNFASEWIDYSNTTHGKNAGLAMFIHDDHDKPHGWLVRDYGTFGPRRSKAKSGKPFTLAKGEKMNRRVGILVHLGDVETGRVRQRYDQYIRGDL